jgi:hypothetical protein
MDAENAKYLQASQTTAKTIEPKPQEPHNFYGAGVATRCGSSLKGQSHKKVCEIIT